MDRKTRPAEDAGEIRKAGPRCVVVDMVAACSGDLKDEGL